MAVLSFPTSKTVTVARRAIKPAAPNPREHAVSDSRNLIDVIIERLAGIRERL
jgi:hypothetical protein